MPHWLYTLFLFQDNHTYIMKDEAWKTIEEEKPDLFEEAVSEVVSKNACSTHTECLKKKGKRYEIERNSSAPEGFHEEQELKDHEQHHTKERSVRREQ